MGEAVEDDDANASFYKGLQHRYGRDYEVTDKHVRVVLTIRPETFVATEDGGITAVSRA